MKIDFDEKKGENYISQLVTDSQLMEVNINSNLLSLKLEFFTDKGNQSFILEFLNIIQLNMSKFWEKEEGSIPYYIVNGKLEVIKDGGKEIFNKTGYNYTDSSGNILTYPGKLLFHFQIEGDVSINLIAASYSFYKKKDFKDLS
jgi:hypothetical protein